MVEIMFGDGPIRRLPIYILIDNSESMIGEPLDAVNTGMHILMNELRNDPHAVETAWVSVITFSSKADQIVPLTEVVSFNPPPIHVGPGTRLGAGFTLLGRCIAREVRRNTPNSKGDYKPLIFLLTDGQPTDQWQEPLKKLQDLSKTTPFNIIAVGCGEDVDSRLLNQITSNVLLLKDTSAGSFKTFFQWVSASVKVVSDSAGRDKASAALAPVPEEFSTGSHIPGDVSQIILAARCSKNTNKGYLMRYKCDTSGVYQAHRAYPVGGDYFGEVSSSPSGNKLDASKIKGAPACPYCGNPGWKPGTDQNFLLCAERLSLGSGQAQVMFVLDVTGSMAGEIEGVKNNMKDFMDYIQSEGLSVEVGLIAFRDLEEHEPPEIMHFSGRAFTRNPIEFKNRVSTLHASGGGGNPGESCYDGLYQASRQLFNAEMTHIVIFITDSPPLLPDGVIRSTPDVTNALRKANVEQVYIVVPSYLRETYAFLLRDFKGGYYELDSTRGSGSFRNVLMNIGKNISVMTRIG